MPAEGRSFQPGLRGPGRRGKEPRRYGLEKPCRGPSLGFRIPGEDAADYGLDGAWCRNVETTAARREFEATSASVRRIDRPPDEPTAFESLKDSRDRARMETEDSRESTRGHSRPAPQHSKRHALGARQAKGGLHPL